MKTKSSYVKILLSFCFVLVFNSISAQAPSEGVYIGIGIGPSFISGSPDFDFGTGMNLNLLNFGYVLKKGIGMNATWAVANHVWIQDITYSSYNFSTKTSTKFKVVYQMLMAGPMYSLSLSNVSKIDFKARAGLFLLRESISSDLFTGKSTTIQPGYSLALAYRYHFAPRWDLHFSGDYFSPISNYNYYTITSTIKPINLSAGIGFLF